MTFFEEKYTIYWESATESSADGACIPGPNQVKILLNNLGISKSERVLDLGCSFGRLYPVLANISDQIYGVDPEIYALTKAGLHDYKGLLKGRAERTNMPSEFFTLVFSWAVFDIVKKIEGLLEASRILRVGGKILFTGKNSLYSQDDSLALQAEKNAWLKGFPGYFTNLPKLIDAIPKLGFTLDALCLFPNRGDMGKLLFQKYVPSEELELCGYEFLILCTKNSNTSYLSNEYCFDNIDLLFSETSQFLAKKFGYHSAQEYFESLIRD